MGHPSCNRPRGSSMKPTTRCCRGYSLIELLVVLVIVGILAVVGVTMIGSRPAGSVRTVMDELEGALSNAHKLSVATGSDVMIATQGDWGAPTTPPAPAPATSSMILASGNAALGTGTILANGATASESFRVALSAAGALSREHMYAGVVTAASGWWAVGTPRYNC